MAPPHVGTLLSCETAVRSPSPPPGVGAGSGVVGQSGRQVGDLKDHPDGPELATRRRVLQLNGTWAVLATEAWLPQKHVRDFAHARLAAAPRGPFSTH